MTTTNVTFTLSEDESARLTRTLRAARKMGPRAPLAIALSAVLLAEGALGLVAHRPVAFYWLAGAQIASGIANLAIWLVPREFRLKFFCAGTRYALTIDDTGILVDAPKHVRVPWSKIGAVEDIGEALIFRGTYAPTLPLLKRALPDEGAALWTELDERLVGRRNLVRGSSLRKRISNTARA